MSSKIRINSVVYNLADGSIYRDYYNETLNNGVVIISQISKLTIEPYDQFEISFDYNEQTQTGTWLNFLILDIEEQVASFNPELYNYTLIYVSRTILLQKIILPNISVTQRIRTGVAKITIYDKINQYVNMYGPKTKSVSSYTNTYPIATRLQNKTNTIPCHEFTLQQPTLFDALNVLLSVLNCIVTVNQSGQIDYIDLTETGVSLVKSDFSEIVSTQMGMEYVSDLQTEITNGLTDVNDMTTETAWISPRQEGVAFMTNEKIIFTTQLPIYKIVEVKLNIPYKYEEVFVSNAAELVMDLTPLVVDYDRYILKKNENLSATFDEGYKKFYMYYKQGENTLNGLFDLVEWYSVRTYINMIQALTGWDATTFGTETWFGQNLIGDGVDYRKVILQVKYIPITSTKLSSSKLLPAKHFITMPNNQETSFVDVKRFGIFNEQSANRLGNPELTAIKRYDAFSSIPALGDKIDDYILASREIAVYDGFVNFKGSFYKDYVQKTLYTGINARRRMWAIAKTEEAIERSDLYKIYAEFGFTDKLDVGMGELSNTNQRNAYSSYLFGSLGFSSSETKFVTGLSYSTKVVGASLTTTYSDDTNSDELFMETALYQAGRSVLVTMTLQDNASAGLEVIRLQFGEPGALQDMVKYVDNNGEFVSVKIRLLKQIKNGLTLNYIGNTYSRSYTNEVTGETGTYVMPRYFSYQNYEDSVADKSWQLPKAFPQMYFETQEYIILDIENWLIYKDSREKTRLTIQNEFCSNNKNIIVTPKMAEYCALSMPSNTKINVRLFYSTTQKYSLYDTIGKGTRYSSVMPVSFGGNSISLTSAVTTLFNSVGLSTIQSWAITDVNNNILFAVNKVDGENIKTQLRLNLLKNRQWI